MNQLGKGQRRYPGSDSYSQELYGTDNAVCENNWTQERQEQIAGKDA